MKLVLVLTAGLCVTLLFMSYRKRTGGRDVSNNSMQLQLLNALKREEILRDRVRMLENESEAVRLLQAPAHGLLQ
jgi:hypothetical protein